MKKVLDGGKIEFNQNGSLARLGDYLDFESRLPFSTVVDGIGAFRLVSSRGKGNVFSSVYTVPGNALKIRTHWEYDAETAVISRRDTLVNSGKKALVLRRHQASFGFSPGEYELYSQKSIWCAESQGGWRGLDSGAVELFSREGRWCEGATPFGVLRDSYSTHGLAFHVFPEGDWKLRFSTHAANGQLLSLTVEAGLSDDALALELAPGEEWRAPEILIQILPSRDETSGTALFHDYLTRRFPLRKKELPVVYNTWLDLMNHLDLPRARRQLKAAKRAGCEVFVVDYGWYNDQKTFTRVDDWEEPADTAFRGRMRAFADEVRYSGLGFGLWIEMEFFSDKSKIVKKHPEWFLPSAHPDISYPKAWLPEVKEYLFRSAAEVIERYGAVYVKNDMNHSQGFQPEHLNRYQNAVHEIFTRLGKSFPKVVFENCSSGSLRAAVGMPGAFDLHFISDNADPLETLRITQGTMFRFLPGRLLHWFVGTAVHPEKGHRPSFAPGILIQPQAATWRRFAASDFDFAMISNLTGCFGISCDLASFSAKELDRIALYAAFYKRHRESLANARGFFLTPPEFFSKKRGWLALQLSGREKDIHFIFVFHCLCDGDNSRIFHPQGLDKNTVYSLEEAFPENKVVLEKITGAELSENGFAAGFPYSQHDGFRGRLFVCEKKESTELA
ncbi:MAG: Alpha-galactosidase [Lentisphaerae bacterium ADurb.Bin242]|nr:MAG: Alpha-galactosidase [Lentisphaerae bacterium ADurb.Bin242]